MTSDTAPMESVTTSQDSPSDVSDRKYRAVIYCRVSTNDSGQTTKTQERDCRKFCDDHGIDVLEVYKDEETGTTPYRDGFSKMLLRIQMQEDVDYVVAYDQSRITRGDDIKKLKALIEPHRCSFRFVRLDIDDSTVGGRIQQAVQTEINAEENRVRNEKTILGMQTRRDDGIHLGRPARVMFMEDKPDAPKGRYKEGTTVPISEDQIFGYARKGYSLYFVAHEILEVPYNSLLNEMHLRDPSNPKCRYTGKKDRFTEYMTLYGAVRNVHKGSAPQRVGNQPEIAPQRGDSQ